MREGAIIANGEAVGLICLSVHHKNIGMFVTHDVKAHACLPSSFCELVEKRFSANFATKLLGVPPMSYETELSTAMGASSHHASHVSSYGGRRGGIRRWPTSIRAAVLGSSCDARPKGKLKRH